MGGRRAGLLAAAILAAAPVVTACDSEPDDKPAELPPITATPSASASAAAIRSPTTAATSSPSPTSTFGMSAEDQIHAVYVDFASHYLSVDEVAPENRREFLAQWLTDPALSVFVSAAEQRAKAHQHSHGHSEPHILSVEVDGEVAHVEDCADDTGVTVTDTKTGEVLDRGESGILYTAQLKRTMHAWKIWKTGTRDEPCTVP